MKNVLFVEDEQRGVNAYFNSLQKKGFNCTLATNGNEAVANLKTKKFDVLSLDVMFDPGSALSDSIDPQRAGLHLLKRIRHGQIPNCKPNMKVVVLTAVLNPQIEEKIKKLGVHAYLKKPIAFEKVVDTITALPE